jgi:lipoprotein-anchoring transpeptidase ErfK/SrfK
MLWFLLFCFLPPEARSQDVAATPDPEPVPVYVWSSDPAAGPTARLEKVALPATLRAAQYDPARPVVVVVDKKNHTTRALQLVKTSTAEEIVEVLAIPNAVGKRSTPTPTGRTTVKMKELDPVWNPPKSIDPKQRAVPPYSKTKRNPLGVAWIGTNKGSIGLHGTNDPSSIGKNVSHGCIRHQNDDILKLYAMVSVGTPVYLVNKTEGSVVRVPDFD